MHGKVGVVSAHVPHHHHQQSHTVGYYSIAHIVKCDLSPCQVARFILFVCVCVYIARFMFVHVHKLVKVNVCMNVPNTMPYCFCIFI